MSEIFLLLLFISLAGLFFGLRKPESVLTILPQFLVKGVFTKQKVIQLFGGASLLFYILFSLTNGNNSNPSVYPTPSIIRPSTIQTSPTSNNKKLNKVLTVIDGDTVDIEIDGKKETVRLIGMDSPETVDPRKPVQCFGKEASDKAKETLTGKMVSLESDPTQGERDKYNRLLRYIFLEDGTNFNKLMISEGYAHEYTYQTPYKYQEEFKKAQKEAEDNKRGLWADNACPAITATPTLPTSTLVPTQPSTGGTTGNGKFTCDCSKACTKIATCDEAYFQLNQCGCQARDADKDGVPCESLCR